MVEQQAHNLNVGRSTRPPATIAYDEATRQRFLAKTRRRGKCLIWIGAIDKETGYGRFKLDGKAEMAHRASHLLFKGPIPDGLLVCHECDVRPCVEPAHLWPGTHGDNAQDCAAKGRISRKRNPDASQARGERVGTSKLKTEQVAQIKRRLAEGEVPKCLAAEFEIDKMQISRIASGATWKSVPAALTAIPQPQPRSFP